MPTFEILSPKTIKINKGQLIVKDIDQEMNKEPGLHLPQNLLKGSFLSPRS